MNRELLKQNFEKRGYVVSFFDTKEEAAQYLYEQIVGTSVGFGGSSTVNEMGLKTLLSERNSILLHKIEKDPRAAYRARDAKVFICSANGVSETGVMVNIDGRGNRVSATLFGPEKMYYVIGRNKIEPTPEKAWFRAKNVAAPLNAKRLGKKTPCAIKGDRCYVCNSPDRICTATVFYDRPMLHTSAEILFIDEDLGL